MAYRIEGLAPAAFAHLFHLSEGELAARNAVRVIAQEGGGYPCRVSLADAAPGEELILLNHVSHDVPTPFRTAYAIYVRKHAAPASYVDEVPDYLDRRTISLRGFDAQGCSATPPLPCRARPMPAFSPSSKSPGSPPSTRTMQRMAASSRASKGIEHGQPCNCPLLR